MNNFSSKTIHDNLFHIKKLEILIKQLIIMMSKLQKRCDLIDTNLKKLNILNDLKLDETNYFAIKTE